MILLLSAQWPQRALLRAQLIEDTDHEVVGVASAEEARRWLATTSFDLVVIDTQGLRPDEGLLGVVRARQARVVVMTGAYERSAWSDRWSDLDVRAVLVRPVFIGEVSRAVRMALGGDQ